MSGRGASIRLRREPLRLGEQPLHGIEHVDLLKLDHISERCDELRAGRASVRTQLFLV